MSGRRDRKITSGRSNRSSTSNTSKLNTSRSVSELTARSRSNSLGSARSADSRPFTSHSSRAASIPRPSSSYETRRTSSARSDARPSTSHSSRSSSRSNSSNNSARPSTSSGSRPPTGRSKTKEKQGLRNSSSLPVLAGASSLFDSRPSYHKSSISFASSNQTDDEPIAPGQAQQVLSDMLKQAKNEKQIKNVMKKISGDLRERYKGKASLREVFLSWDENRDGFVDGNELQTILQKCGIQFSIKQSNQICDFFGDNKKIPYSRFIELVFKEEAVKPIAKESYAMQLHNRLVSLGCSPDELGKISKGLTYEEVLPLLRQKYQVKSSLRTVFRDLDVDKDGWLSKEELQSMLAFQGINLSKYETDRLFAEFDSGDQDGEESDGRVQYDEFVAVVFPVADMVGYKTCDMFHGLDSSFKGKKNPKAEAVPEIDDAVSEEVDSSRGGLKTPASTTSSANSTASDHIGNIMIKEPNNCGMVEAVRAARIRDQVAKRIRRKFDDTLTAFNVFDTNNDGAISHEEFRKALINLNLGIAPIDADTFLLYVDPEATGFIQYDAFCHRVAGCLVVSDSDLNAMNNKAARANASNIGRLGHKHVTVDMKRKTMLQRYMYPTQSKINKSAAKSTAKSSLNLNSLHAGRTIPTRRGNTPSYDTSNLIVSEESRAAMAAFDAYRPTSRGYGGDINSSFFKQPERLLKKQREHNRMLNCGKARSLEDKIKNQRVERYDSRRQGKLEALLKTKLHYFETLERRQVIADQKFGML